MEGCPACNSPDFGCCPDGTTPKTSADDKCDCQSMKFGERDHVIDQVFRDSLIRSMRFNDLIKKLLSGGRLSLVVEYRDQ